MLIKQQKLQNITYHLHYIELPNIIYTMYVFCYVENLEEGAPSLLFVKYVDFQYINKKVLSPES